jgi:signal transduction histidine kinase
LSDFVRHGLAHRLMLGYAAVIAAVMFSAWWMQRSVGGAEQAAARLAERSIEGIELSSRLEALVDEKNRIAESLLRGSPDTGVAVQPHRREFATWLAAMRDFVRTDEEQAILDRLEADYAAYTAGFDELAHLDPAAARLQLVAMADDAERLLADGRLLARRAAEDMSARRAQAGIAIEAARSRVLWLTGLGGLLSLLLGFALSRYVTAPIYQLALRLGSSGVVDRIEVAGDELGTLAAHVGALLARVRDQERALQQAEKLSELGEIASEIAHETLNPLAGVKGMLQALRRTPLPPERLPRELLDMERELARVEGIVRRLVHYARPLEAQMRPVSVRRVVGEAVDAVEHAPAAQRHSIRILSVPRDVLWVMDPDLVRQVIVNLLVNGCEASPEGATVEIETVVVDGRLQLHVRDHGTGIKASDRERLFHPFFTTKRHGNGLGLAVSRNIVREHGGRIEAIDRAEGGTIFTVELPGREAPCAAPS